jgi:SAM-dependent methyltransferase
VQRKKLEKLLNDEKIFISGHDASVSQLLTTDEMNQAATIVSSKVMSRIISGYIIYELKPDSLKRNDKVIAKLRLLLPASRYEKVQATHYIPTLLYIRYDDGERESLQIKPEAVHKIQVLMNTPSYAHGRMASHVLDWESKGISPHYFKETPKYYEQMGKRITEFIISTLDKEKKLNVVDIGCGDGTFLIDKIAVIPGISWVGVDLSADNIKRAKEKITEKEGELKDKKEHFIVGNMLNINDIIKKAFDEEKLDPNVSIIITALGSITRLVLPNGFVAAKVFQEIYQIKNPIYVMGCGIGEPLITNHMAKRIGFELKIEPHPGNFFSLQKIDEKSILNNKKNKILKSHILDLSLSPVPEIWLNHSLIIDAIKETSKPIIIDVSYCKITESLLNSLSKLIHQYQQNEIELIYFDTDPTQILVFEEYFSNYKNSIQTDCITASEDILLSAPKRFFDTINYKDYVKQNINTISKMLLQFKNIKDEAVLNNEVKKIYKKCDVVLFTVSKEKIENIILKLANDLSALGAARVMIAYANLKVPFNPELCKLIYMHENSLIRTMSIFKESKQEMPSEMITYITKHRQLTSNHAEQIALFWIELTKNQQFQDRYHFFDSSIISELSSISQGQLSLYKNAIASSRGMTELEIECSKIKQSLLATKRQFAKEAKANKIYDRSESDSDNDNREKRAESDAHVEESPMAKIKK